MMTNLQDDIFLFLHNPPLDVNKVKTKPTLIKGGFIFYANLYINQKSFLLTFIGLLTDKNRNM